ncbi:MAG: antitoxin StbD [Flavobacteriales bacterium]|jgi:antitoxin StbD
MLQKILCEYTTSISKFKANPSAALSEAGGDAVAVSSHNEIQFYAVPANIYEDMVNFLEYAQRGTTEINEIPAEFNLTDEKFEKMSKGLKAKAKKDLGGFEEC